MNPTTNYQPWPLTDFSANWQKLADTVNLSVSVIDASLDDMLEKITLADNEVVQLQKDMQSLNLGYNVDVSINQESGFVNLNKAHTYASKSETPFYSATIYPDEHLHPAEGPHKSSILKGKEVIEDYIKPVTESGEHLLEIADKFGKLSAGLKSAQKGLSLFNKGIDFASHSAGFIGEEGVVGGLEGVAAVTEGGAILAETGGITAGSAAFGPPGWVVGAMALLSGLVLASMKDDDKGISPEQYKKLMLNYERDEDIKKLSHEFNVPDGSPIPPVILQIASSYPMQAEREERVNKAIEQSTFKYYDDPVPGPQRYAMELTKEVQSQKQYVDYAKMQKEIKDLDDKAQFEAGFSLVNAKKQPSHVDVAWLHKEEKKIRNKYHNPKNPWESNNGFPPGVDFGFLSGKNPAVEAEKKTAQPNTGARATGNNLEHLFVPSSPSAGRVINININKPMIGSFTINAKEVKEGVGDLKHKVEEALLEILNSANAIH